MSTLIYFKKRALKIVIKLKSNFTTYSLLNEGEFSIQLLFIILLINYHPFVVEHQDIPKVPIKTYKWEDVRRTKKSGAYPWTHLTKPPFDEEVDPEEFTMDAFRRSRSPSSMGKSETQEISEVEEIEMNEEIEEHLENQDEVTQDNKENIDENNKETTQKPSSSKETPQTVKSLPPIKTITESRSKSEEPKKKRKLSLETYTKNLPKLDLKDKLKDAKSKIKVPKLPKRAKSDMSETKSKKPKLTQHLETTRTGAWMPPPPDKSPVYIHIPLKPPPGETDEYSKYEFESPGPSSHSGSLTQLQRIGSGRKMSLLGLLTEIKKVAEKQQKLASESKRSTEDVAGAEEERKPKIELVESFKTIKPELRRLHLGKGPLQRKESDRLVIEDITEDDKKSTKSDTEASQKPKSAEPIVDEPEDSSADDNVSQYLDKDDKCEIVSEKSDENVSQPGPSKKEEAKSEEDTDPEKLRKLEATLSRWKKQVPGSPAVSPFKAPSSSGASPFKSPAMSAFKKPAAPTPEPAEETERPRAKSEEPKRKRKSSIESSHSRKSLSKLAFMKRLKEAKDKIKLPKFPSFSKGDKKEPKELKPKEKKKEEPDTKAKSKLEAKKPEHPVYIHIPLKLPPGQKDEFSHLAEEIEEKINKGKEEKKEAEESESSVPTSPDVPKHDVQLIILTPPSDDEVLSSVPATPSETDQKSFESMKIDDLKNLAKRAVDQEFPETQKLETVAEDEGSDEQSGPESSQEQLEEKGKEPEEDVSQKQSILVDEEDGLKLSEAAIAMINEELAKELKEQEKEKEQEQEQEKELKPSLKKKVSFKRKSRAEDGERIYEDVQLSSDPAKTVDDSQTKKLTPLETSQSMSVEEEKSYLDKKVIKDTSLEEDYNKWSKLK